MTHTIRKKVNLFYIEGEKRTSDAVLNSNAFNNVNDRVLEACKKRLAIFLHHSNVIRVTVERDLDLFYSRLSDPAFGTLSQDTIEEGVVAIYAGVSYLTALHGILYSLKSFLDIFAFFVCGSIDVSLKGMTFSSKSIEGKDLAGGNVINWLRCSAPVSYGNREALAHTIESHSQNWINEAVKYRDRLSHYGDLLNFMDMHVIITSYPLQSVKKESIVSPRMPDGTPLLNYNENLVNNVITFINDVVSKLPSVNMKMLNFDVRSYYTGRGVIRIEEDS